MDINRKDAVTVDASASEVLEILVDAGALPEWNPAFSAVSAAGPTRVGEPVGIRVQGVLRGQLTYDRISSSGIDMTIRIPGLAEHGTWLLEPAGPRTRVTHEFTQTGSLARALEAGTRNVATLRVTRLRERLEALRLRPSSRSSRG